MMRRQRKKKRAPVSWIFLLLLVLPAFAVDQGITAVRADKIFTVSHGTIADGLILIERGKIVFVGSAREVPKNAILFRAKVVMPGLIDTHTHLGTRSDWNEYAGDANPALKIMDALNLESADFAFALSGGTTTVVVTPGSGNVICGQLVVVKTAGESYRQRVLRNPAGVKMAFDMPQALRIASDELDKARDYPLKREKAAGLGAPFERDAGMEVLAKVLRREIPAHIHCIPSYALENVLRLKEKYNIDVVIEHGLEADADLDRIRKAAVSVSFGPLLLKQAESLPDGIPALLAGAGIRFSIHSDAPIVPSNGLLVYAGQAVKYGLNEEAALKAVTLSAAEILGISDRVGSLEAGKDADLVLLTGEPLDIFSHVEAVLIDGREVFNKKDYR